MKITSFLFAITCLIALSLDALANQPSTTKKLQYTASLQQIQLPKGWYLGEAAAVEFNSEGHMWVFNRGDHALLEFDASGQFIREIGQGLFKVPHGLRIDKNDNIWTTDQATHQVIKFNPQGLLDLVIGRRNAPGTGWFDRGYSLTLLKEPSDVAFDKAGNIYIADAGNFRIAKFNQFGEPVTAWGTKGDKAGEFNFPHSLIIDKAERLYVTDRENGRIQVFSLDGTFIEQWRDIGNPYVVTLSDDNHLWMTDARAGKVLKLSLKGEVLGELGEWGKQIGKFGFGHGIAVTPKDEVYISEILNLRLQKLTPLKP